MCLCRLQVLLYSGFNCVGVTAFKNDVLLSAGRDESTASVAQSPPRASAALLLRVSTVCACRLLGLRRGGVVLYIGPKTNFFCDRFTVCISAHRASGLNSEVEKGASP